MALQTSTISSSESFLINADQLEPLKKSQLKYANNDDTRLFKRSSEKQRSSVTQKQEPSYVPKDPLALDEFSFNFMTENKSSNGEKATFLQLICNNVPVRDEPEFVDVNKLTLAENLSDPISISDDDDVIFVKEFKESKTENKEFGKRNKGEDVAYQRRPNNFFKGKEPNIQKKYIVAESDQKEDVRRNPVRKTRSTKTKESFYEDDFAFLDHSDEENYVVLKKDQSIVRREKLNQWPTNAYERPEYNPKTKTIENFDYTIREIQKTLQRNKPKSEKIPLRRKSRKNYCARKRRPRLQVEKKVPIEELKALVNSTFADLKEYQQNCKEYKRFLSTSVCAKEHENKDLSSDIRKIFISQSLLCGIVNGKDFDVRSLLH